ncbi:hypothetical protein, partial [Mycobacterium kiyosense]
GVFGFVGPKVAVGFEAVFIDLGVVGELVGAIPPGDQRQFGFGFGAGGRIDVSGSLLKNP